jgi:sortase A
MLYRVEKLLWAAASALILVSVFYGLANYASQQARLAAFESATAADLGGAAGGAPHLAPTDRSDWSPVRIRKFRALHGENRWRPQAVLRIPAVGVEAEIFGDTGVRSLDLGVGHIEGTAAPGAAGNVGIAGHRDGYFRRLKDVRPGQRIEIETRRGRWEYEIERTRIVDPTAVEVLARTGVPRLTLVTCYPFYFLGNAPQRFIVHARMVTAEMTTAYPPT